MHLRPLLTLSAIAASMVAFVAPVSGATPARPNLLFILADDMGWQDMAVPFGPERTPFGIRVPLLVRWPERVAAQTVETTPVIIYDWFATLLAPGQAAGSAPVDIDGRKVLPLLRGQRLPDADRALIWHFPNFWGPLQRPGPVQGPGMSPSSTIRRGDWKLIYYHTDQRFELFNLAEDVGETRNRAATDPARWRALAEELTAYLKQHDAPMPVERATGRPVPWPADALKS